MNIGSAPDALLDTYLEPAIVSAVLSEVIELKGKSHSADRSRYTNVEQGSFFNYQVRKH